jgi:8-oxo-dGTP pyrophosphatase MutT (NUDIX family)
MTALIPNIPGGILKLKTLCVGNDFNKPVESVDSNVFPWNVLAQKNEFSFTVVPTFRDAQDLVAQDQDIDLVFLDADHDKPSELTVFMTQVMGVRPKLPVIIFAHQFHNIVYDLLKSGRYTWPVLKDSEHVQDLVQEIQDHVFASTNWTGILEEYAREGVKPRIEPGLDSRDLEALNHNLEEGYIIKRLFADSELVQIFRLDEGFTGSRIYTVKPSGQRKRIVKIEAVDSLETVREKQERLIQPRLDQRIGQIQGEAIFAQYLGGACYTLAGSSSQETITLAKFLQDRNQVRREQIDSIFEQLASSLTRLYEGSSEVELRYWAPLYARDMPPELILEDATLAESNDRNVVYSLSLDELTTLSGIPGNRTLEKIRRAVRDGEQPEILLDGFVVSEVDSAKGILYLHDDLMARHPFLHGLTPKDHAILRFKINLKESAREMLTHPIFRHGKRVCVRGRVVKTQEGILACNIAKITGQKYDYDAQTMDFEGARFISPLKNVRYLLWEVGREDVIIPVPQISPVTHGDLNTGNILVEVDNEKIPVWLIDFAEARPGHIYLDLAKLEIEFRTHILYRLFKSMVEEKNWDDHTGTKFALLLENVLYSSLDKDFNDFLTDLRDYEPDWYDQIDTRYPLYFENLIYFMYRLRLLAKTYSPERFEHHYPVAVFFQSITALKFENLDHLPWHPWSKRLALCCALVSGRQAVAKAKVIGESILLSALRERSAFALISVGTGNERKYLVQWNDNWKMFNLVGGKMDSLQDKESFARTVLREIREELGIRSEDCRITQNYRPVLLHQFSKRDHVFKDYEFQLFQIEFLPKHPANPPEFALLSAGFSPEHQNRLVSLVEVEHLVTLDRRPISDTTKIILIALGEIESRVDGLWAPVALYLDTDRILTSRGRAKLTGYLINPPFAKLVEKIVLQLAPSQQYDIEKNSAIINVERLEAGEAKEITFWLIPNARQATIGVRATYYYDVKGREQQQFFELNVTFESGAGGLIQHVVDNPYVVGTPLKGDTESLFFGREDIFAWMEENLIGRTQPQTLILHGPRRMGKTSILYQLADGQRGQNIREYPGCPIFPVYFDLQSVAGREIRELLQKLAKQIARALAPRGINVTLPPGSKGRSPFGDFDEFLDQVEIGLPKTGVLVIMLDEFEQLQDSIAQGRLTPDIFPYLRSLIQHRSHITFVLAGTHQLEGMSKNYGSTLFPVGLGKRIGSLSRAETKKLILEPVFPIIQYDDPAVEQIYSVTQGHPYFVQLICHDLISTVNIETGKQEPITFEDVKQTIGKILSEQDHHLRYLWSETTREEKLILAALSMNLQVDVEQVPRTEITACLHRAMLSENIINQALEHLLMDDLVKMHVGEEQNSLQGFGKETERPITGKGHLYFISFDLFRQWIAKKHPLGTLLP